MWNNGAIGYNEKIFLQIAVHCLLKGEEIKTSPIIFCFPYISSLGDWIFKVLVSIPHNKGGIMGGRHQNNSLTPPPPPPLSKGRIEESV